MGPFSALIGRKNINGIFITTSSYSREAVDYVEHIDARIILIDGEMLSRLMVDHDLGVTVTNKYEVKKIDTDYFEE